MATAAFWDDASNIEDLAYRILSGEGVSMPPRVPAPRFDATLPTQLVQLEQFLRKGPAMRPMPYTNTGNTTPVKGKSPAVAKRGVDTPTESAKKRVKEAPTVKPVTPMAPAPAPIKESPAVPATATVRALFPEGFKTAQPAPVIPALRAPMAAIPVVAPVVPKVAAKPRFGMDIPSNADLAGSRREKLDLTTKRIKNQKCVDPDLIFGCRNFDGPLKKISPLMNFAHSPRRCCAV